MSNEKTQEFLFLVFTELNEHIRATDEKNVLVACSFVALIAVIATLAVDKFEMSWKYFVLSLFILIVGFCVQMLQFWYREWKEHYLEVCRSISSKFSLDILDAAAKDPEQLLSRQVLVVANILHEYWRSCLFVLPPLASDRGLPNI